MLGRRGLLGFSLIFLIACSGATATDLTGPYVEGAAPPVAPAPPGQHDVDPPKNPDHPKPPGPACTADPSKYDFPGNAVDEDCSGKADDEAACDDKLVLTSSDPMDAAKALGLCKHAPSSGTAWG